jgi:hypothetical protein
MFQQRARGFLSFAATAPRTPPAEPDKPTARQEKQTIVRVVPLTWTGLSVGNESNREPQDGAPK